MAKVTCSPCSGTGTITTVNADKTRVTTPCAACSGTGTVEG